MQKINSRADLRNSIIFLENKRDEEGKLLKQQFHLAYESIKPINLIKNTFREASESVELKDSFLITAIGLGAGYFFKKIFIGASRNPLRRLAGAALLFGITKLVAKHPEEVKLAGRVVLKFIGRLLEAPTNYRPQEIEYSTH